ncbi:MAG: Type 1 glutamine amidotransferase-like domain-containing protein [Butyrivibrio sp.]
MIFLTSTMGENYFDNGKFHPKAISEDNCWRERLKKAIPEGFFGLVIAASPEDFDNNDSMCSDMKESYAMSEINVSDIYVYDYRNRDELKVLLDKAGFVILSGGHVPTQNKFFREVNLKSYISEYKGLIIGISAGTMNCAKTVYACPELPGEASDRDYKRYIPGLGLTDINVLPHYQYIKDVILDGMNMSDILIKDSYNRPFIALTDGSYIMLDKGSAVLYGEAYTFRDGRVNKICDKEQQLILNGDLL